MLPPLAEPAATPRRRSLRYDDFAVYLEAREDTRCLARILHSIAGGGAHEFEPPFRAEGLDDLMAGLEDRVLRSRTRRLAPVEPAVAAGRPTDLRTVGEKLHASVLGGRIGHAWSYHRGRLADHRDCGLRLRLVFDPSTPDGSFLAAWPWELIYRGRAHGFLARDRSTPVVRHLDVPHTTLLPPVEPPLRVLVVAADPVGYPPLSLLHEEERLRRAWPKDAEVTLEVLRETDVGEIRERLLAGGHHVLHFMGHGLPPEGDQSGALVLRAPGGGAEIVPAEVLADHLRGLPDLRLAVLSACDTARFPRRHGRDPYGGVAVSLVVAGLPSVIAMQFPISDPAAIAFGRGFYRALAAGDPVDAAVAEGRLRIVAKRAGSLEWATPVHFSRASAELIPHSKRGLFGGGSSPLRDRVLDFGALIEEKTRGFVGRRFLFEEIEAFRAEAGRGYFEIIAEPGIGKSALVAEMVRRDRWAHHFNQRSTNVIRPEAFLSNVCAQLALAHDLGVDDLPPEATRDGAFLVHLLGRVSRRLEPGDTAVVLVDALDEASDDGLAPGVNPLCLPPRLPPGIVFVLTSRPRTPALSPRADGPRRRLELHPTHPDNLADVREHVATFLPLPGVRRYRKAHALSESDLVSWLTEKSEGNFMYLSYVLPAIDAGTYDDRPIGELPGGLLQYYEGNFARMRGRDGEVWMDEILPVIGALAVSPEPLPFEYVHAYSGVEDPRRVRRALREIRPYLSLDRVETGSGEIEVFRFYHESFFDFLRSSPEVAFDREAALRRMVEAEVDGRVDRLIERASPGERD